MKLVTLTTMYLNETNSNICIGKRLSIHFLFRMVWNKEMPYHHYFLT